MKWFRRFYQATLALVLIAVLYLGVTAANVLYVAKNDSASTANSSQAIVVMGAAQWSGKRSLISTCPQSLP